MTEATFTFIFLSIVAVLATIFIISEKIRANRAEYWAAVRNNPFKPGDWLATKDSIHYSISRVGVVLQTRRENPDINCIMIVGFFHVSAFKTEILPVYFNHTDFYTEEEYIRSVNNLWSKYLPQEDKIRRIVLEMEQRKKVDIQNIVVTGDYDECILKKPHFIESLKKAVNENYVDIDYADFEVWHTFG